MTLLLVLGPLLAMAFFTLLERKVLGASQVRLGPNKSSLKGALQPIWDAIKLFKKQYIIPSSSNRTLFFLVPLGGLAVSLLTWTLYMNAFSWLSAPFTLPMFLLLSGLTTYIIFLSGWASHSVYSLYGALRGVAQAISYEITLMLMLLWPFLLFKTFDFYEGEGSMLGPFLLVFPMVSLWLISCLAETNRAPFDFAEGESELVSGFNLEYGGGGFSLIFMAEYLSVLFLCYLTFLMPPHLPYPLLLFLMLSLSGVFLWVRATLPRLRYDMLMLLCWVVSLPATLTAFLLLVSLVWLKPKGF